MIRFGGTFRFSVSVVGMQVRGIRPPLPPQAVFGGDAFVPRLPLELAGYVLVLTSTQAGAFSPHEILELYRCRWQIEMTFKRLKSLIALDTLPAKDPQLARTFLYSKLSAALLVEDLMWKYLAFSPWGYRLHHPPALHLAHSASAPPEHDLRDPRTPRPTAWVHKAPRLQRHFFDAPRKRKKQAAHAQLFAQRIQLS